MALIVSEPAWIRRPRFFVDYLLGGSYESEDVRAEDPDDLADDCG